MGLILGALRLIWGPFGHQKRAFGTKWEAQFHMNVKINDVRMVSASILVQLGRVSGAKKEDSTVCGAF